MAVAARKLDYEYYDLPATRVYSHVRPIEDAPVKTAKQRNEEHRQVLRTKHRAAQKEALRRLTMLMNIAVAASAILLILSRYNLITLEYQKVNELRDDISSIELEIKALNVQFNSVTSLVDAKAAATAAGMRYPTASQIVVVEGKTENRAEKYEVEFLEEG